MELEKKTTILFPPEQHERLTRLARERGVSLGQLVREACEETYGGSTVDERLAAVERLGRLSLPVGSPQEMEEESVPAPDDLLP